jgi:protein-disulfide isomerase
MLGPPLVTIVPKADDPVRGPASAPVRIVEFSDFQCPFCGRVAPTLLKLKETFGDKISIVFKDFPLPNHPLAQKAAEAAQCARVQGKFWEYHDTLFANQAALEVPSLKKHAAGMGLDATKFDQCLDTGEMASIVQDDMREGHRSGVSSTPAFFVNGRMLLGAQPYEAFETVIKDELARK